MFRGHFMLVFNGLERLTITGRRAGHATPSPMHARFAAESDHRVRRNFPGVALGTVVGLVCALSGCRLGLATPGTRRRQRLLPSAATGKTSWLAPFLRLSGTLEASPLPDSPRGPGRDARDDTRDACAPLVPLKTENLALRTWSRARLSPRAWEGPARGGVSASCHRRLLWRFFDVEEMTRFGPVLRIAC